MSKLISITLTESAWTLAIEELLKSNNSYFRLLGQTFLKMMITEKNLQDIKDKAHI